MMGRVCEDKLISRRKTNKIVTGTFGMKQFKIIPEKCKHCGSKENLQIHHEYYPRYSKDIKRAIINGRIYFLCKSCHFNHHTQKEKV